MCVQGFYGATLDALAEAKNERLWFKTQLKLCALWFKLSEFGRLARILKELHRCVPSISFPAPFLQHIASMMCRLNGSMAGHSMTSHSMCG